MPASHNMPLPERASFVLTTLWDRVADAGERAADAATLERIAADVGGLARQAGMLPEYMVVAVKDSWQAHPRLRARADRVALEPVLGDLVARMIRAYFDAPLAAASAPEPGLPEPVRRDPARSEAD